MTKRNRYTPEFKSQIVLEIFKEEKSLNELASQYGIHVNQLRQWKKSALEQMPQLFMKEGRKDRSVVPKVEFMQVSPKWCLEDCLLTIVTWTIQSHAKNRVWILGAIVEIYRTKSNWQINLLVNLKVDFGFLMFQNIGLPQRAQWSFSIEIKRAAKNRLIM